jgi:hypothetical protein
MFKSLYRLCFVCLLLYLPNLKMKYGWAEELTTWPDEKMIKTIRDANLSKMAFLKKFTITQNSNKLEIYDQIGREELARNLQRRPIIKKAIPEGLYHHKTNFFIIVDRDSSIGIDIELEIISISNSSMIREPVREIFLCYDYNPGHLIKISDQSGHFNFMVPPRPIISKFSLKFVMDNSLFQIDYILWNKKKKVTIAN